MKKFDPKLDDDLYKFVEDFCYQNREVQLKDINPLAIELDERRFSDKTKKMPEAIKRKRLQILLDFNKFASQLVPFIDYNTKLSLEASARLNAYFMKAKEFIMYQVKYRYQTAYVNSLEVSTDKRDIPINRLRSLRFFDSGKCDHTGEYTVFGQCFKSLSAKKYFPMMVNNSTDRAWNSKFIGEGSIDVGGPYRETFFEMCRELQSHALPLLLKTSNHKNDFGEHRDKWIPNPSSTSPTHI
jgi:E3 ubiquitin-protein ligase HERC2